MLGSGAIKIPVPDDDDDDLDEENTNADILEDINRILSDIHSSLRVQNLVTQHKMCYLTDQCILVDALLSQSSHMSGMLYGVTHECLRHLRAATSSKATLKHASTHSIVTRSANAPGAMKCNLRLCSEHLL